MSKASNPIGPKEFGALATKEDDNPDEYIGFLTFSTTGEALVPREWLVNRWRELKLPDDWLPKQPTDWMAYRRTKNAIDEEGFYYTVQQEGRTFNCRIDVDKSGEQGSNIYIVKADVFWPEELIGVEGGDWRSTRIGYIDYYESEDGVGFFDHKCEIGEDNIHYPMWETVIRYGNEMFEVMKRHHNQSDLQNILESFRARTMAAEIRRAVYFVGSHEEKDLDRLSTIWGEMNEFKDSGERMRIDKTPVVNMSEQRNLITEKIREQLEKVVDNVVTEIVDSWDSDDGVDVETAAEEMIKELSDGEETAETYSQLLDAHISIGEILEDRLSELEEADDLVENVLERDSLFEIGK